MPSPVPAIARTVTVASSASGDEPLRLVELPAAPLGRRDVRVRVGAVGVNPVDWKMRTGGPIRMMHRFIGPKGPLVVGVDFAGEVVEAGADADLAPGARVVGGTNFSRGQRGSYATEVVVRDDQCARLPDAISFEAAACLPVPGATAMRAFELARIDEGRGRGARVLVLGASGGVGLITLELARAMSAKTVGVCSTRNLSLVEGLGAVAIDYTRGDPLEAAAAHGPFDLVMQAVGTATYPLAACRSLLAPSGVVALIVVRPADFLAVAFAPRVRALLGRPHRANLEPLVDALARGDVVARIEERFPLADAERAHEISRAGKVVGKLILLPGRA